MAVPAVRGRCCPCLKPASCPFPSGTAAWLPTWWAGRGGESSASSRYAVKLRDRVRQAAGDPERRPVLMAGEPGLEKDDAAA